MLRIGVMLGAIALLGGCFTKEGIVTPYNPPPNIAADQAATLVEAMDNPTDRQVAWLIHLQSQGGLAKLTKSQAIQKASLLSLGFQCSDFRNVPYQRVSQIMATSYTRVACPQKEPPWDAVVTASIVDQVKAARTVGFECDDPVNETAACTARTVFRSFEESGKQSNERTIAINVTLSAAREATVKVAKTNEFVRFIPVCGDARSDVSARCRIEVGGLRLVVQRDESRDPATQKLLETRLMFSVVQEREPTLVHFFERPVEVAKIPHVEDVDGDGDQDVVVQLDAAGTRNAVWLNNSTSEKVDFVRRPPP